jgi:hypothetical protein
MARSRTRKPRKKYRPKAVPKPFGMRDPWPLEGEVLAARTALANDAATVRTFDILIPWLMLVHRIAYLRNDLSTGRVAEGAHRTCMEIFDSRILVPTVVNSDDPSVQRIHVSSVHRESLGSTLSTLIDFIKKAKNAEIMKASTELMKENL